MFHSAAVKLTVWYLAIIMAISISFSVALYHASRTDLVYDANRQIGYFNNFLGPIDTNNYQRMREKQLSHDLRHIRANLVFFNVLVLVLGGGASYLLARRTLRPIEDALRAQSRFTADASHELRTPLAAIQAENEVALRDPRLTKAEAASLLKSNLEEVSKLKALAEGLLQLAGGQNHVKLTRSVPIKPLVKQAASQLKSSAAAKRIKIVDKTKNYSVRGEPGSLAQLLVIFLDNSIKYSPVGSTVELSSQRKDRTISISVTDHGQGIAPTDLPHIFERFYRADSSRSKTDSGGYGLGLSIAQKIAQAHQGHIEVVSSLGNGSTFTVYLPAAAR